MGRFDTSMHPPPVRIGLACARVMQDGMVDFNNQPTGAGNYGQKELRFSSVPIRLRIKRAAPVNGPGARTAAIAPARRPSRRKRGYPPITGTLPE
jgi:hypothetical protein